MKDPKRDSFRLIWILGAVMTLPAIFISGPIAGYLIGHYVLRQFFHAPAGVVSICVALGFIASALQIFRLILKIKRFDRQSDQDKS